MKIAIQGHPTRGKEVIQILESLAGLNSLSLLGTNSDRYYFIYDNNVIMNMFYNANYKIYTLEEFEKEFLFKVGDKVKDCSDDEIGTILGFIDIDGELMYVVNFEKSGHANMPTEELKPYKEMERNVTLTLEKAKEWYKKGGELREIALQAYSEEELNSLPRSWEEFSEKYCIKKDEAYINSEGKILTFACNTTKRIWDHILPSKKSAEAHLTMMQLEQLRDCWRQGWKPKEHESVYAIKFSNRELSVYNFCSREFLSFSTKEMAEEFLKCFRDLIEKAGDLI